MARRYADRRVRFIVDDAIFPNWEALGEEPWRNALQGVTYTLLVLLPSFDAVRERNRLREGQRRLREETLQTIYNDMQGWRERDVAQIDNTGLTVAETATLIERNLHGTSDGPGRWVAC